MTPAERLEAMRAMAFRDRLNRKPPPGTWRDFMDEDESAHQAAEAGAGTTNAVDERPGEEFELARVGLELEEAGHG